MKTAKQLAAELPEKRPARAGTGDIELGDNLRKARERHGLTSQDVADALGFTRTLLFNIETGKAPPSLGKLVLLAAFYEVTLDDLAGHLVEAAKNGDA